MGTTPYIRTLSGLKLHPFNPHPSEICITDIVAGLSKECRYSGQVPGMYSVAEHSLWCSYLVEPKYRLVALLHDASEAYLRDLPAPFKHELDAYLDAEFKVSNAIYEAFHLEDLVEQAWVMHEVKKVDKFMGQVEYYQFRPQYFADTYGMEPNDRVKNFNTLMCYERRDVYPLFLNRFNDITDNRVF